jgi:hypothetical protein
LKAVGRQAATVRESAFELRLCAALEREAGVVARQVGASARGGRRVVDVLAVEPGPEFERRVALSASAVPPAAVESDARTGEFRPVTDVLDGPPAVARRIAVRAAEAGFFEREYRDGTEVVRRAARYPDWVGELVGIENKPDLGRPGDLETQLRKDVSLAVLDRVVLATASHVTGAHLNRIPGEVGVWRVEPASGEREVVREPAPLDVEGAGVQLVERHADRTELRVVPAAEKARRRRRMAERAYGKGWRPDAFPACERVEVRGVAGATLPWCAAFDRVVDPSAECGPDCPAHRPADPPAFDAEAERAARTPWERDPPGAARRQSRLDRYR